MQTEITAYQPYFEPFSAREIQTIPQERLKWSAKEVIVLSLFGMVLCGGAIYAGTRFFRNRKANKEEGKSFEDGTSATYAKQIKMALENDGWYGTDTEALRNTLREIPNKADFGKVIKSYETLYSKPTKKANLLRDLSEELQTTEYNEMLQIIAAKPDKKGQAMSPIVYSAWAKRLKAAFDKEYGFFGGTDGEAIVAVFNEIHSQGDFLKVAEEYKRLYGKNLIEELKSESEFGQYEEWMSIITAKNK